MTRRIRVVVIAPVGVSVTVNGPCRHSTMVFSSINEFERWRHGTAVPTDRSIGAYVKQALVRLDAKPNEIAGAVDWLCRRHTVPTVKEFASAWSSRRTFFRMWKCDIPISPHFFLHLVRALFADDLIRRGMDEREVMRKAGFRSAAIMRDALDGLRKRKYGPRHNP